MDGGACRAAVHGAAESEATEPLGPQTTINFKIHPTQVMLLLT